MSGDRAAGLVVSLFGGLVCRADGALLRLPSAARARSLLAYLALQQGQPQRRDYLAYSLWPDSTEEQARTNLRQALFGLLHLPSLGQVLIATRATIELNEHASVDARQFVQTVDALSPAQRSTDLLPALVERLESTVALYRGDLVPELLDDWFMLPRERFRREVRALLLILTTSHAQRGELRAAVESAERLAALDTLDEEAQRLMIELQWRSGRLDAARAAYDGLLSRLRSDLGVDPDADTVALGRRLTQRPAAARPEAVAPALSVPRFPSEEWAFVGREAETEACAASWRQALEGNGGLVMVSGVAGIGKSRLVHEVLRGLDPPPAALALGGARAPGDKPFGPLVEAVRRLLAQRPPSTWPVLPRPWSQAIGMFLPELGDAEMGAETRRQLVLDAWAVLLHSFGRPFVLAIDDVPWADEATLSFLGESIERLPESGWLILTAARASDAGPGTPTAALAARAERLGVLRRIELSELNPDESLGLVRQVRGGLGPAEAQAVTRRAAGHPLFLVELARATQVADAAGMQPTDLPASIRALVSEQVRRALPDTQTLLSALSVLGTARPSLLAAILEWPDERVATAAVSAFQAMLAIETSADGALGFVHDLLRDAVFAALDAPARRLWHRRAATMLANLGEPDAAARAASHSLAAGDEAQTLPLLLQAAEADLRRAAPDVAVSRFDQACHIADRLERYSDRQRALHGLARAQLGVGNVEGAASAFESARSDARVERDRGAELEALAGLVEVAVASDQLQRGLDRFREMLGLPITPGDEIAQRVLVRATTGCMALFGLQRPLLDEGRAHIRSALRLARRLRDADSARVLESDLVDFTTHVQGPWPQALRDHQRLDDHFCAAWLPVWMGRARQAVAEADIAIAQARWAADYSAVANAQVFLGTALGLQGDYVRGFQLLEQAPAAAAAYSQQTRLWQTGFRILLERELGLWSMVTSDAKQHLELCRAMGNIEGPFIGVVEAARLHADGLLGDDLRAAMEQLHQRAETLHQPDCAVDRLTARLAEAELALCVGDPVRAMQAAEATAQIATALGASRELAHAARVRALAAHRMGQSADVASSALDDAATLAEQVGEPSLRWRVLAAAAEIRPSPASQRLLMTTWEAIRAQLPPVLLPEFDANNATSAAGERCHNAGL